MVDPYTRISENAVEAIAKPLILPDMSFSLLGLLEFTKQATPHPVEVLQQVRCAQKHKRWPHFRPTSPWGNSKKTLPVQTTNRGFYCPRIGTPPTAMLFAILAFHSSGPVI